MNKEKIMELKLAMDSENKINDEIAIKRVDFEEQNKDLEVE